jgi:predicted CoA-binding protein
MAQICEFFNSGRIALVGVSRNVKDFTRVLFREFLARGYDAVPVHPGVGDIEGHPCFARIQEITPPVEAALLLTAPHNHRGGA